MPLNWKNPSTWPWVVWVWAAFIVAAWARQAWKAYRRKRPNSWPSVLGHTEAVDVLEPKRFLGLTLSNDPAYTASITYSYGVAGRTYSGTYRREFGDNAEAWEFLRDLQGRPVTVQYNAAKPSLSAVTEASLEEVLRLRSGGAEPASVPAAGKVPLWFNPLLRPLAALSLAGLALSVYVHLSALLGRNIPGVFWVLHVGIFIVWFPAVFVAQRRAGKRAVKDLWEKVLKGTPAWMRYLDYALAAYGFFLWFIFPDKTGDKSGSTGASEWLGFSQVWMVFYYTAFLIAYAAIKERELRCVNGHAVPPGRMACPQCGQTIPLK